MIVEEEKKIKDFINIQGWKGKSGLNIIDYKNVFVIKEWRKNKETGIPYCSTYEVTYEFVSRVYNFLCEVCEVQQRYSYRYLVKNWVLKNKIHEKYGLDLQQMVESFNGGKFRKLEYFPFYYSLKVLESKGLIVYYGRGGVMLLKKKVLEF
ncbi:MAG: hypothetical protein QXU20_03805 [Candidatus Woesearchaeota archaeon]